jgi:nodulation protein E
MTRIVVSGVGVISPVGCDAGSFWKSVVMGHSNLSEASVLPGSGIQVSEILDRSFLAGLPVSASAMDRNAQFAVAAAGQALVAAGLDRAPANPERIGVILGNGAGGQCSMDEQYVRLYRQNKRLHPLTVPKAMVSSSASWVSMAFGAKGPSFVTSSACASSSHAIGIAMHLLRAGLADVIITGGTEAPLSVGTITAWDAMKIMSRTACRPFAKGRDGLILAEGAGIVVLETEAHALRCGRRPTIEAAGFGFSADAGNIVSPDEDGMVRAMTLALTDAKMDASDLAYINAHGTGTRANDRAETIALKRLFEDRPLPPISSTKGVTGHALGAAGAFEAIATIMAIENDTAPPTANFDAADPECDFDCVPNEARPIAIPSAMSNSFAFGGLNAALIFRSIAV